MRYGATVPCDVYSVHNTHIYLCDNDVSTYYYTVIIAKVREVRENSTSISYNALF